MNNEFWKINKFRKGTLCHISVKRKQKKQNPKLKYTGP